MRSWLFAITFYASTAAFLVIGSPLLLGTRSWAMAGLRAHAHFSLWLLRTIAGIKLEVRGREHLPPPPFLIAAKHQSAWDTFGLIPIFRDPALVMKAELGWLPFYGWFSLKFEHILVQRGRAAAALKALIRDARSRAAQGREILIFPEGTRRAPGALPDYKPGVVALYEGLGLPCVPVALNSGLFWPRRQLLRYPGTIIVEIMPALPAGLPRAEFRKRLEQLIEQGTQQLVLEAASATSSPPVSQVGNETAH